MIQVSRKKQIKKSEPASSDLSDIQVCYDSLIAVIFPGDKKVFGAPAKYGIVFRYPSEYSLFREGIREEIIYFLLSKEGFLEISLDNPLF